MSEQEREKQSAAGETVEAGGDLLGSIIEGTQLAPDTGTRDALAKVIGVIVGHPGTRIHQSVANDLIAELDQRMSAQIDEIIHHAEFQKIESAWRSLKLLVDRTNFRENIRMELLNVSKEDLLNDFEDSPEVMKSGLYKHVYSAEYGQFGGQPVGAMVANYEFDAGPQDMKLLGYCASVAAMAHAPFFASASHKMFGCKSWQDLPNMKDLKAVFEGPQYAKWRSFRDSEDSRYVGLTAPRFLLRLPYGSETVPVKEFNYEEKVTDSHDKYLWGSTAFAFASKLTDSFAKSRWCTSIIGPQSGGTVEDLPVHVFKSMGAAEQKIPTEILISERREFELAEEGFIALTQRKGSDNACFFSANSCQRAKTFGNSKEGKEAEANFRLGTQLPYMFIVNRLAHYIKVIQRENIGSWKEKEDLNRELNAWIGQYVAEMDVVQDAVKRRRPLRQAQVIVEDVEGNPGWYKVDLRIRPHFKYMGAFFSLSLVGKLDKK